MQIMTESNRFRLVRIPKVGMLDRIHGFPKYSVDCCEDWNLFVIIDTLW
jgi:hypothetical protein